MKPITSVFIVALALAPLMVAAPMAGAQPLSGSGAASNPYNSPIKRANPNSRQGTVPSTPVPRPGTAPTPRAPSLENGGIGNGQTTRQPARQPTPQVTPVRPAPTTQSPDNRTPPRSQ